MPAGWMDVGGSVRITIRATFGTERKSASERPSSTPRATPVHCSFLSLLRIRVLLTASCPTTKTLVLFNLRHYTTYALQPHALPLLLLLFFIFPFFCSSLLALSDNCDTAYRRKAATTRQPAVRPLFLAFLCTHTVTGTPEVAFTSTATDIPARARSASAMTAL